jgi:hypothetical protein
MVRNLDPLYDSRDPAEDADEPDRVITTR